MLVFWTAAFFRHNEWIVFAVFMFALCQKLHQVNLNSRRDASGDPAVHSEIATDWLCDLREVTFLL